MTDTAAFAAFERAVHDRIAESYHAAFTPVTEQAHTPLLAAAAVAARDRVLDVASGPGVLAAKAQQRGAEVTGVDLSPRMVELGTRLHPAVTFREANAEDLPFANGQFDVVLSGFGIGHFAAPDRAFAEFHRVLAPGGRLAVAWWAPPEQSRINGLFFEAMQDSQITPPTTLPPGPSAFLFSDENRLHDALKRAGFSAIATRRHEGHHRLPDFEALWSLARGSFARLGTTIEGLDYGARQRFKAAASQRALVYGSGPLDVPIAFDVTVARA